MSRAEVDWRAVGIGAAVGIGGSLLLGVLLRLLPSGVARDAIWVYPLLSYGAGALVDIACGATAGALARRGGARHGFLAGMIAGLVSPLLGLVMYYVTTRGALPLDPVAWLLAVSGATLLGVALATLAGAVAARVAAARAG